MGASQSLDALFGPAGLQADSEQGDVYQYLRRAERTLWLEAPYWESDGDAVDTICAENAEARARSPSKRLAARDPFKKLTAVEALALLPGLLDDHWISPLAALADCVDPIARSAGLALLSRVVHRASGAKIFLAVGGMAQMMALLDSQDPQSIHLSLEVIFSLCAGTPNVVLPFCEAGLISRLTELAKGDKLELVLASLKVLRLTLRQSPVKAEVSACKLLAVLLELVHSPHGAIAKTAVICIGLSLPNADNLAEILRLGCIDIFLRLMTPSNPNVDAVIFALSLIADEADSIFPREQTTTTLARMLETLRGAAKRSATASATSFLFASLAKSSIFHGAICTETNLGILAKLLVGGSPEVLAATAYALGVVAIHANDRVRLVLFQVDAPQHLMQLVKLSLTPSSPGYDEKVARLAIFALGTITNEALVAHSGAVVKPDVHSQLSAIESLRTSTIATCSNMQGTNFLPHVFARAITRHGVGSSYALKLLAALSSERHVREHLCEETSVSSMLKYLCGASSTFLPTLLILFLECCGCDESCGCGKSVSTSVTSVTDTDVSSGSVVFCRLVEGTPGALGILGALFQNHQPEHLLGLAPLLTVLAAHSVKLTAQMSDATFFVDQPLSVATRLNLEALHEQVLAFLVGLTSRKNARALEKAFASDPDRIANLLQASVSERVQLLAATLLRRLFKRMNAHEVPSRAAQRHLAKLLGFPSATSPDLMVAVAACRVWGNLFQFEDKRLAFAQLPDATSGLLTLLQRSITYQPDITGMEMTHLIPTEDHDDKRCVPGGLKPLYQVIRSVFRTACCELTKQAIVAAPHFLSIAELFPHPCDPIARFAIDTMSELARSKTPGIRRTLAVPTVLNAIQQLLRDYERVSSGRGVVPQCHVLRFLGLLARKDAAIQHLVVESRLLEALLQLLQSPSTALNSNLLAEALEALAWVCSAARSPTVLEVQAEIDDEVESDVSVDGEAPARRVVATPKTVEFTLRHADSTLAPVARASLHLLQRLACEQPVVPQFVFDAGGAAVAMRALQQRPERSVRRRACGLVRNLVHHHDGNRQQFQELGATSFLVALVTSAGTSTEPEEESDAPRKLQIKGLRALAALCEGTGTASRACKQELLECEESTQLLRLVSVDDVSDEGFCAAWTRALAMAALASSTNQRRLVSAGIVPLLTKLLKHPSGRVRVPTAQLLAYLAQVPENRGTITGEGGEELLAAVILGLQSELPGLQRYAALFVAYAATRHEGNKVLLGAAGAAAPLVDRLSSQRLHVLENVLLAVVKLGSHAGNKVKLGGKVCFDKLLALIHHEALPIAKGAARALAVLVVGNDANKRFLLQCESPVVAELTALLRGSNGTIVESAMLVLGELAPMPAQALELSRCVDVLSVVKLLTHVNPRIAKAALLVVRHLTRESFNKTRFGLRECVDALLKRLRLGLAGSSGAEELELVELTITCLANLSFASTNASRIAEAKDEYGGSLLLLLQLVASALHTPMKDYLTGKESQRLMMQGENGKTSSRELHTSPSGNNSEENEIDDDEMDVHIVKRSPKKSLEASDRSKNDEAEIESSLQTLDFTAFPSLQTAVLEQTLLVLSNCSSNYRADEVVDALPIAVLCQALGHSSELVARCACYTLACWLKRHPVLQDAATKRGILPALAKLLTSTSLVVVEAAAYVLSKLAARGDNPLKLLALDVPATLVHGILRKSTNVPHDRVLDRALRLLGTLAQVPRVRQALKGEEIIADVLTPLLQLYPQALGKNLSRLVLALLADDSLKFFLPKKTVSLLRACFVHDGTSSKTIRNVLQIFALLVTVEEHKITITLEDSGEALSRMVDELRSEDETIGENDDTVLGMLAHIAGTRKIAAILHENDVYARLPPYLMVFSQQTDSTASLVAFTDTNTDESSRNLLEKRRLHAVQIAARLCKTLGEQALVRLSELEFTSVLIALLRFLSSSVPVSVDASDPAVAPQFALTPLVWTSLDVLRQLIPAAYDEQVAFEEGGVSIFVEYFEAWLFVASGNAPALFPAEGDSLVLAFAVSLAAIVRTLAAQTSNRELFVQSRGYPLLLKALSLGSAELPDVQRGQLAEALAGLSPLPMIIPYLEAAPELVAPLFRFMVAPQTQQLPRLLLLALRVFADVVETSPASRSFASTITGGAIQPLPFLLSCLEMSGSITSDTILKLMHTMRSIQRLVMDEPVAEAIAKLGNIVNLGKLLHLGLPVASYDDRLEIVQLMATDTIGYMAFFGYAPQLKLEQPAISRLLAQTDFARNERVKPEGVVTSIWSLGLLATPHFPSSEVVHRDEVVNAASQTRQWMWQEERGLDLIIASGLRAPEYLNLPSSVTADVLAILVVATEQAPDADILLHKLIQKRVCTPVASFLEAVEPTVRLPALQLLARLLKMQPWSTKEPSLDGVKEDIDTPLTVSSQDDIVDERWSVVLLHLAEWMQVYAQDPATIPINELRGAFRCLSVLTARNELAGEFYRGEAPRGLMELVSAALHHFGAKRLPSRPESLVLIRKISVHAEDTDDAKAAEAAERAKLDWMTQFDVILHALRVCRRLMSFSKELSERALALHIPRALDNLVILHDRRILDEALRCMLHLATLHGEETELLFSSDRTVARLKALLQSEGRPLQARITPIIALMAANMPTLPGLCGMDGILILADLAVSSASANLLGEEDVTLDRRVFEDVCAMLLVIFSPEEGVVLAFDVAQVVSKLFGIVEDMTSFCIESSRTDALEAPELLGLPVQILVKMSTVQATHVRFIELLPRVCRLIDGESGPARLTGKWCEMLLSILFNVFGCPYGSSTAVCNIAAETLAHGNVTLLPRLLPLARWLPVTKSHPALGRFVVELIRAFVGNGDVSSPYSTLFNSGEDIPALLALIGSPNEGVAIPSAQLLLVIMRQRDVRVAVIVADGVAALVAALCQATSVKVQNLVLALLLDLSRGDTEVQAILLNAPGCVERLVEFVQDWLDTRGTASEKQSVWSIIDKRLALSCTLLTELSRALHGPERIVQSNGHIPLLALSIQQQVEEDVQGAQTTVQILTNLANAGVTVAPGLVAAKLPAHFLSCILADEKESAWLSKKHALPLKRRLAVSGLLSLAKANRELRADLAKSAPLVALLENMLQLEGILVGNFDQSLSRDALMLLYLMSTNNCIDLVSNSSPEILTRVCGVIKHYTPPDETGPAINEILPVEVTKGLKLLANVLDDTDQQQLRSSWHPEHLLDLSLLIDARIAAHQTPKKQLPALRALRGAFALRSSDNAAYFYFPLSPKLLTELFTVLLVSASRQHRDTAERIIVCAFQQDPERARASVGDNQILEQLLILFTQPGSDRASELAVVLTQVLYISISRSFIIGQRFLGKLPALLASYADENDADLPLKRALSIYVAFVHSSNPLKSAMRAGISDMLRSEGDSRRALGVLLEQLLRVHDEKCLVTNPDDRNRKLTSEDIMLWSCVVESVYPQSAGLLEALTAGATATSWLCFLRDWFHCVEVMEEPTEEVIQNACRMLSVLVYLPTSDEEPADQKNELCGKCLTALSLERGDLTPREVESALQALMDAREKWGEAIVINGCCAFEGMTALILRLLQIFHLPEREANRSRHLVLQLLLLLAGTGHFVDEMRNSGVRSAVENNPLISAEDKALPVALLGMLGYSSDLNEEFAKALAQFDEAQSASERRERLVYLLRFLERYSLTHAPTKEHAIDSFMTHLVADAEKAQAATASDQNPEEVKSDDNSADQLSYAVASDCLAALVRLAGLKQTPEHIATPDSNFGELYLARWDLNALLAVAFARQRGGEDNDFQERSRLSLAQIAQVLELAAIARSRLDDQAQLGAVDTAAIGHIDERWLCNAYLLVDRHVSPSGSNVPEDLLLVDQVLVLQHWLATSSIECFTDLCRNAGLLRSFLAPLTPILCGDEVGNAAVDPGSRAMELFLTLVEMVVNAPPSAADTSAGTDDLLNDLIKYVYAQIDKGLRQGVRSRLLLCILVILKRAGDAGRAATAAYERAMQQILWHIHALSASELQARCSWELLGSLSELDPAITSMFNLDAIPILLRECGCDPNPQYSPSRTWRDYKHAVAFRLAESLKCLSRAARTHDEVLLKIGEAPGIATVLFGALASSPIQSGGANGKSKSKKPNENDSVDSAGTQAHAAHLIARIAAQEDLRASLVSPENIALLIESLESVHLPVVLHSLQALAHLCSFSLCLDALVRYATVPVLAQILFSPLAATARRQEIESCVIALLAKMCSRSQIVSRRVVSSNLLPKLREFLVVEKQQRRYVQQEQPSELDVHNNAVWVVRSLSDDAELVPKLASHGILETLCDQLHLYNQNSAQQRALGAMSRIVGVVEMDVDLLETIVEHVVDSVRRNAPFPDGQRTVTSALKVMVAILRSVKGLHTLAEQRQQRRPQSQQQQQRFQTADGNEVNVRQILLSKEGIRVALELLGSADPRVKLQAFIVVSEFVDDHPEFVEVRELLLGSEEQGGSHALLSLVRAISDEVRSSASMPLAIPSSTRTQDKDEMLLVLLVFLNMLLADETLKVKLTPTTYDVVLQAVVATPSPSSLTTNQTRILAESLKALTTMTRAGQMTELCPEAALVNSVEALVQILRRQQVGDSSSNTTLRLNALFLLVNFASSTQCRSQMARCGALEALLGTVMNPGGNSLVQDEQLVQLALLGVALMTTGGVSDAAAVVELTPAVEILVRLLSSKNAGIQANAVWVVSNISSDVSLKSAIIARGGPTALQALLNENMSTGAGVGNGNDVSTQRPSSSTMRIREYAPKAIKALGFAPIMSPAPST